jgi:hypothetical protein
MAQVTPLPALNLNDEEKAILKAALIMAAKSYQRAIQAEQNASIRAIRQELLGRAQALLARI